MKKEHFIALTLFSRERSGTDVKPLYQENIVLVQASSEDEARQIAEKAARSEATSYKNADGETVSWAFEKIVDVTRVLDTDLSQECVDLYTRHFNDMDAYETFDRGIVAS